MDRATEITKMGNPKKPEGEAGGEMLARMNVSHAPLTEWALSMLKFGQDDCVLDIGCGGGAALKRISERVKRGKLFGIDYSPVSVQAARKTNESDVRAGKVKICEASVEKIPFPEKTFDKILTVESFYFWPDPPRSLREVARVLKNGGTFVIAADVYRHDGMSQASRDSIIKYELNAPTADEFRQLLTEAGFKTVMIKTQDDSDRICVIGMK